MFILHHFKVLIHDDEYAVHHLLFYAELVE